MKVEINPNRAFAKVRQGSQNNMSVVKWLRLLFIPVLFNTSFCVAQEMTLKLEKLEMINDQEKGGDELFFSITEYPQKDSPKNYQVPSFPTHWLSKHLSNVKDVVLWKKTFKECQDVDVYISLVEEDLEPWDLNDFLGGVQLKLQCQNGKMTPKWHIPDSTSTVKIQHKESEFSFTKDNARYRAVFKLENSNHNKVNGT